MTDNITDLIGLSRDRATRPDCEDAHLIGELADTLEITAANRDEFRNAWNAQGFEIIRLTEERDERELALSAVPGYTKPQFFKQEFDRVMGDLVAAEAERDRYRAEAESARKTGERILADALRYRAAIEGALAVPSAASIDSRTWRDVAEDRRAILTRALNEGDPDE